MIYHGQKVLLELSSNVLILFSLINLFRHCCGRVSQTSRNQRHCHEHTANDAYQGRYKYENVISPLHMMHSQSCKIVWDCHTRQELTSLSGQRFRLDYVLRDWKLIHILRSHYGFVLCWNQFHCKLRQCKATRVILDFVHAFFKWIFHQGKVISKSNWMNIVTEGEEEMWASGHWFEICMSDLICSPYIVTTILILCLSASSVLMVEDSHH